MSEKHTSARQLYWSQMDPETKSKRMADIATKRQSKLTKAQRRAIAMKLVAAKRAKRKHKSSEK
jgi:peptide methionine sulfoxide reductase MsrA